MFFAVHGFTGKFFSKYFFGVYLLNEITDQLIKHDKKYTNTLKRNTLIRDPFTCYNIKTIITKHSLFDKI